jgi:hypothetical protein
VPAADEHRHRSGFWAAAFAFLIVMAVATLPSPLYGLYRPSDHLSALTITVVFAIFAASTIAVLRWDSAIAARIGRRGVMLGAVATMMVAMGVLAVWKDLPGLTTGIVLGASPPESRVAMTSNLLIALYVGLSVPVIGAGVALDLGASAPNTVLMFAILVGLGVAVTGWALLGRRGSQVHP